MDADRNIIPIVEDDMGEGMKDPCDIADVLIEDESFLEKLRKIEERKKRFEKPMG